MGYLPEAMINHLALSGWSPGTEQDIWTFDELVNAFSLDRCSSSNAIFDYAKLLWLNGYYIRHLAAEELARRIAPGLGEAGLLTSVTTGTTTFARLVKIVTLEQERLKTLADASDALRFFFQDPDPGACIALMQSNRFARRHPPAALRIALDDALTDCAPPMQTSGQRRTWRRC